MSSHTQIRILAPHQAACEPFTPDASPLQDDEIAGYAVASAISPGTEIGCAFSGNQPERLPCSTGYAMVFCVQEAGPTSGFAVGDLAFTMANHRSWVRTRGAQAWHVPAGLDPAVAALARLAAVSWTTLVTTAARPPSRVLVSGLGIVGNFAAQIFHAAGYRVLAVDPVAERRALLDHVGIETCAAASSCRAEWKEQIELAIDCSGHEAAILDACRLMRKGGEVVMVGVPWIPRTDIKAHALLDLVFHRYIRLRSGWEWEVPRQANERGSRRP
jgi:D-arabinose 1-dehydrogenase-like Zn-dependent alcohol dehydrogenase